MANDKIDHGRRKALTGPVTIVGGVGAAVSDMAFSVNHESKRKCAWSRGTC